MKRIDDKIGQIRDMLSELHQIMPASFEQYLEFKTKAACERYFERITEATLDLAVLLIRELRLENPQEKKGAFDILAKDGLISSDLALKLKQARGMRNIIAHEYGTVDDELVYQSITKELTKDTKQFLKATEK